MTQTHAALDTGGVAQRRSSGKATDAIEVFSVPICTTLSIVRRFFKFLGVTAILVVFFPFPALADDPAPAPKASPPIVDVQLGTPAYFDYGGDSWDPTWAQDDDLYAAVNDGAGFGTLKRNIAFNKISGSDPLALTGQLQNIMDEYGEMNAPIATDGRNWKSGGSISIDGVLYLSIGMDRYVDAGYGGRQTRINASIIKSNDHGLHWTRQMKENLERPMFPGMRFATPFFIHFGKEYAAATVDNADRYVYATSNNGFWDNGDNYILGRVLKTKINALNASDWTFYQEDIDRVQEFRKCIECFLCQDVCHVLRDPHKHDERDDHLQRGLQPAGGGGRCGSSVVG